MKGQDRASKMIGTLKAIFHWPYRQFLRWRIHRGAYALRTLDDTMRKGGWPRSKRRQFWREFVKDLKTRKLLEDWLDNQ